jgi:hypothetical protein
MVPSPFASKTAFSFGEGAAEAASDAGAPRADADPLPGLGTA